MSNESTVEIAKEKLYQWLQHVSLSAGQKLPSERELCELFNVKRMTLRQALLTLEAEEKIFSKDKKGWFLMMPKFIYNVSQSTSFNLASQAQSRFPSWRYLNKEEVSDFPDVASVLLKQPLQSTLYCVTGWGALEGHKVFYHKTYINPIEAPHFIDYLQEDSFWTLWQQKYQRILTTQKLVFHTTRLLGVACSILGLPEGAPATEVVKYRVDENRQVVQVDIEYWRSEAVTFVIDL